MDELERRLRSLHIAHCDLPAHLKEGQYDITLLYAEDDRKEALKLKEIIEKFVKLGKQNATVCTIDQDITWIQGKVSHLGEAIKRSNYAFLYITDSFRKDMWSQLQKDECIMESIFNQNKSWFTVPVFTNEHQKEPCQSLTCLRGRKGIDLYRLIPKQTMNDVDVEALNLTDFDAGILATITQLLRDKLTLRLERDQETDKAIHKWLDQKENRRSEGETNTPSSDEETDLLHCVL